MRLITLLLGMLLVLATACFAATITLNWTPVTDPKLYAHRIYYSNYSSAMPLPYSIDSTGTENSHTFNNVSTSKKYCYAVSFLFYTTAHQTGSIESVPSNKQCGVVTVHDNFGSVPNYRSSGADNFRPETLPEKPLPDCTPCHGAKY
jgi:hypothetical protein